MATTAANQHLGHHDRHSDRGDAQQVDQNKGATAVFAGDVGKFPDIAKAYRRAGRGEYKRETGGP